MKMQAQRWNLAALILAPMIALAACDQVGDVLEKAGLGGTPLRDVAPDARSIGGAAVLAASDMEAMLAPDPLKFVPGEILVGAKVDAELAGAAAELGMSLVTRFSADGAPQEIDPRIEAKAIEEAVEEATRDARTVLTRMRVKGEIEVAPSGMVTIDLTPENAASPTGLTRFAQVAPVEPPPGAVPAETAAAEPAAVIDEGLAAVRLRREELNHRNRLRSSADLREEEGADADSAHAADDARPAQRRGRGDRRTAQRSAVAVAMGHARARDWGRFLAGRRWF
jgi:hypothetical protein